MTATECRLGYTRTQLTRVLLDAFDRWMIGQTIGLCEGRRWNRKAKVHESACGGVAHGPAYYPHDVDRYLAGLPCID